MVGCSDLTVRWKGLVAGTWVVAADVGRGRCGRPGRQDSSEGVGRRKGGSSTAPGLLA